MSGPPRSATAATDRAERQSRPEAAWRPRSSAAWAQSSALRRHATRSSSTCERHDVLMRSSVASMSASAALGSRGAVRLRPAVRLRQRLGLHAAARPDDGGKEPPPRWRRDAPRGLLEGRALAAEEPRAVLLAPDLAALRELGERRRHGGPAGADELAQELVRERHREHDAARVDLAPALRQVPEEREEAPVDPRQLRDRLACRQASRPLAEPVQKSGVDLGIAAQEGADAAVEHGDPGHSQRAEADPHGDQSALGPHLPRPEHVAGAQQLRAHRVRDQDLAAQRAVDHEQSDVLRTDAREAGRGPLADRERVHVHGQLPCRLQSLGRQKGPELGVEIQERVRRTRIDHVRHSPTPTHAQTLVPWVIPATADAPTHVLRADPRVADSVRTWTSSSPRSSRWWPVRPRRCRRACCRSCRSRSPRAAPAAGAGRWASRSGWRGPSRSRPLP